ncbi:uncharacterized protein K452DRAFT_38640 [Aplosporella prunicola CBS 121167]|uniref:Uncharacterized protein n=1 Tax=Aplosporella prunicola CBS 121167 TaxID=1176127 RepID=A0A6A6BB90_9PEZI|nr:uncharacterized protein K452DRAFT_38640 [Aplosporella prunicola CBS 121167]KAF2141380.1 hypothetical protein K452DRAFT_38640 [Aplosporella prunicola CBS 121167]
MTLHVRTLTIVRAGGASRQGPSAVDLFCSILFSSILFRFVSSFLLSWLAAYCAYLPTNQQALPCPAPDRTGRKARPPARPIARGNNPLLCYAMLCHAMPLLGGPNQPTNRLTDGLTDLPTRSTTAVCSLGIADGVAVRDCG